MPTQKRAKTNKFAMFMASASFGVACLVVPAVASDSVWIGGTSDWATPTNWNPTGVPTTTAIIQASSSSTQTVTYDYTGPALNLIDVYVVNTSSGNEILSIPSGTLAANKELVGGYVNGAFDNGAIDQNGGDNTVISTLQIGGPGGNDCVYSLSGGSLSTSTIDFGPGADFVQTGGTLTYSYFVQSGSTLIAGANSPIPTDYVLGTGGPLSYEIGAGSFTASTIEVDSGGSFGWSGGTFSCTTFNQNGGLVSWPSVNASGTNVPLYQFTGVNYNYTAGTFSVGSEYVAASGSATRTNTSVYDQSGDFYVGYNAGSSGAYNLSNTGSLSGDEYVGYNGDGTFMQNGGTNTAGGLGLGWDTGSSGSYVLSAGTLTVDGMEFIGNRGQGTFIQTGGTHIASFGLSNSTGTIDIANGSYALSGGTLSVTGTEDFVNGSFIQSGGSNSASVILMYNGNYSLSAGSLSVTVAETFGEESASGITQSGGTHVSTQITLGDNGGTGQYNLEGGILNVSGYEYLGAYEDGGTGEFNQAGGSNTVSTLQIGYTQSQYHPAIGVYTLTGGALNVTAALNVAGESLGTLNITNSDATAASVNNSGLISLSLPSSGQIGTDLDVTGNFTQSGTGSELQILIGGPASPDGSPLIDVQGSASLAGALDVSLIDGFLPYSGETFVVLESGSTSGAFESQNVDRHFLEESVGGMIELVAIPEPTTSALFSIALLTILRRPNFRGKQITSRH
jgi:hypothetical protein